MDKEFFAWAETGAAITDVRVGGVKLITPMCAPVILHFGEYCSPDGQRYRFVSVDEDHEPVFLDDTGERVPFKEILRRFAEEDENQGPNAS